MAFQFSEVQFLKGVNSQVISDVRSRANIVEVIAQTVVLKRAGNTYKGLCPFHSEKTPSFHVNPDKGIYKCFGCGEGGDVFAFVQKVKGMDFLDTVRDLAYSLGVPLIETTEDRKEYDRRSLILMLYQQASEFYTRLLKDGSEGAAGREYLKKRGISEEIIEKFKLGIAPHGWDALLRYLMDANKVSADTLVEAGLVRRKTDTNHYFDLFRNRLMIPILDEQGRVIAFGGRALGDDEVKYINSPENPVYTKGDHLFAFSSAKDAIKQADGVILVEGYFDAISLHQHGFANAVATLGTALTEKQAKLLVRYTDNKRVYLCFDSDLAGQKAADRGRQTITQIAEGIGIDLRVISIVGGKDPDEFLRDERVGMGAQGFSEAIANAAPFADYSLDKAVAGCNLSSHTGRIEASKLIVPILAEIKNAVARGEYIRQWAAKLLVREEELLSDVGQYRRHNFSQTGLNSSRLNANQEANLKTKKLNGSRNALKVGHIEAEQQLLSLYLTSLEDHQFIKERMAEDVFIESVHQRIKEAIEGIGKFNNIDDLSYRLMDRLGPDQDASSCLVDIILKVEEVSKQNLPREVILREARARIWQERLNQEKNKLRALLPKAQSEEQQIGLQSRIKLVMELEKNLLWSEIKTEDEFKDLKHKINALLLETVL